jgi:murein DD-endopeptidase MepM/ murein hydrolase activator NlpD
MPVHGRVLVWEGHDFFAHHRRVPLDGEKAKQIGLKGANANRYASDLVIVNERGEMFHDDPYHKTNYYSYGQPIYAPADGVVRASRNDIPDNEFEGKRIRYPQLPPGADEDLGNFVLIDHQDGEFSVLPHMRIGTVHVKAGDRVHRGDVLGEIGFSGDAIFPHVHFALLSGPDIRSNGGVPCYFDHVTRLLGGRRIRLDHSALDTGDIVTPLPAGNPSALKPWF